jgi:hypothetical protein
MATTWIQRWKMTISSEPVLPGVWKRKEGGHVVYGAAMDPRTGKRKDIRRVLNEEDPRKALAWLTLEREKVRRGLTETKAREVPAWNDFAESLFAQKVEDGTIQSAKGREKWATILGHLAAAPWADYFVDRIKHADLVDWRASLPSLRWERRSKDKKRVIKRGKYAASTLNDWLAVARVIFAAATIKYELPRDPMVGIEDFPIVERTYTREEPNALTPEEVGKWLATFREKFPQFYAMAFLGLVHGQRPSTLRPIRRQGATPDLILDGPDGARLLLRRSHTLRDEVWDRTKTKKDLDLALHPEVVEVLKWHIESQLKTDAQRKSDLLFPTQWGKLRSKSCLDKPFAKVTELCKLGKKITPRAMRRTFQDLMRKAEVEGVVTRAISGHATDAMRVHYSTAADAEVRGAVGKIVDLAKVRERKAAG